MSTGEVQPTLESCRATFTISSGYNVGSDETCGLDHATDQTGVADPLLGGLALNGAFAESLMPLPGSPVLDVVPPGACRFVPFGRSHEGEQHLAAEGIDPLAPIDSDQRGGSRPFGPGCDVGSVEAGSTAVPGGIGPREPLDFSASGALPPAANVQPGGSEASAADLNAGGFASRVPLSRNGSIRSDIAWSKRWLQVLKESANRYSRWSDCLRRVPVSEYGNDDNNAGYRYDEVDGSGERLRSALARDRDRSRGYYLFDLSRERGCRSEPAVPGGTADPARASACPVGGNPRPRNRGRVGAASGRPGAADRLRDRLERLEARADLVARAAGRFDRWESCLRWLPAD